MSLSEPPFSCHIPYPATSQACSDPSKAAKVTVVDNCDKCEANQINLKAAPFSKLASLDVGRIKIEYKEVRAALCQIFELQLCFTLL